MNVTQLLTDRTQGIAERLVGESVDYPHLRHLNRAWPLKFETLLRSCVTSEVRAHFVLLIHEYGPVIDAGMESAWGVSQLPLMACSAGLAAVRDAEGQASEFITVVPSYGRSV